MPFRAHLSKLAQLCLHFCENFSHYLLRENNGLQWGLNPYPCISQSNNTATALERQKQVFALLCTMSFISRKSLSLLISMLHCSLESSNSVYFYHHHHHGDIRRYPHDVP